MMTQLIVKQWAVRRGISVGACCLVLASGVHAQDKRGIFKKITGQIANATGSVVASQTQTASPSIESALSAEQAQLLVRMLMQNAEPTQIAALMQSWQAASPQHAGPSPEAITRMLQGQVSAQQLSQLMLLMRQNGVTGNAALQYGPGVPAMADQGVAVVVARQSGRQGPIAATRRERRFVVSQANVFADVVRSELIGAAIQMGANVAQQQMYAAMYRHADALGGVVPMATGSILRGIGSRMRRNNAQRGFEFDFVRGTTAVAQLSADAPVEFLITPINPFATLEPAVLRTDVVAREGMRVLASRKIELRETKASSAAGAHYERTLLGVEKNAAEFHLQRNADGTTLLCSSGPLPEGEYALVFQTGPRDTSDTLDTVYEFRIRR